MIFDLITSILFGIIVAIIIFYLFIKTDKIVYRGPNSKDIKNKIFKDLKNDKCYMFEPKVYLC